MKMNIGNLKRLVKESTEDDFKKIIADAYPWLEKPVKRLILGLYASEGWYPDDVEEFKEDLPKIIDAHATPGVKKIIMSAIQKPDDDDDEDYDDLHAQEWMDRHPHGWYNNEHDYGDDDDEDLRTSIEMNNLDAMPVDECDDSIAVVEDDELNKSCKVGEAQRGGVGYSQNKSDMYIKKMQQFVKQFGINEFFDLIADNLSPRAFEDGVRKWLHPFASDMQVQESREAHSPRSLRHRHNR